MNLNVQIFGYKFYYLFQFFILYAFLGWTMEVLYAFYKQKKFVNRGFLHGPFCPMYGLGAVLLTVTLKSSSNNIFMLFIIAVVVTSTLEYFTGFLLEKIFNTTWWDYSTDAFNLKGRICLGFSLLWGVLSIFFVKVIHPFIKDNLTILSLKNSFAILNLFLLYFIIDLIWTIINLIEFNSLLKQLHEMYKETKEKLENIKIEDISPSKIEAGAKELKNRYEFILHNLQNGYSRFLKAFPELTIKQIEKVAIEIKNKILSLKIK